MKSKDEILSEIVNSVERREIAIDIYDNFNALVTRPVRKVFFDAIWQTLKNQFDWLKDESWGYKMNDELDGCFYISKLSWRCDKDDRGVYSFGIEPQDGWGLLRNGWKEVKDLNHEESPIFNALNKTSELLATPNDGWWLTYKVSGNNLPKWNLDTLRAISNPESSKYKTLFEEYIWRMETMLMCINKETNLEDAIDKCIKERKKNGKL